MPRLRSSKQARAGTRRPRQALVAAYALACLLWVAPAVCEPIAYDTPEWRKEITHGYLPYHRLVAGDFPINDKAFPQYAMYTSGFFHYNYNYEWATKNGRITARITKWSVRSGFNRNKSSRKSWYKPVARLLPHEQGHLDINELHSRRLAHVDLDELPVGKGETSQEAADDLKSKIEDLADKFSADNQVEQDAYDARTSHGRDQMKQLAATAAMRKRLEKAGISYGNDSSESEPADETGEEGGGHSADP